MLCMWKPGGGWNPGPKTTGSGPCSKGDKGDDVSRLEEDRRALPALYACSPRAGGNSDRAADLVARGIAEAGGVSETIRLRTYNIHPCIGCNRCRYDREGRCFLTDVDQSSSLYQPLIHAPFVFLVTPVYFYHVPSQFKAFIDRSQSFYLRREGGDQTLLDLPRRPAWVVMFAARPKGEKLFEGALLTLKYFLRTFNLDIQERMLHLGKEGPLDLDGDGKAVGDMVAAGRRAWEEFGA
ncbi:MAG: flavodoxin family protein [Deltaproteobacteria bacterium]|nr:flavodoxin family protein [Deltaproteobacteria bacterium]